MLTCRSGLLAAAAPLCRRGSGKMTVGYRSEDLWPWRHPDGPATLRVESVELQIDQIDRWVVCRRQVDAGFCCRPREILHACAEGGAAMIAPGRRADKD